jgi:hypothetical protein
MRAWSFDVRVLDTLFLEPRLEEAIHLDEVVIGAASDPKQLQSFIRAGIETRKFRVEIFVKPPGAEGPDPGKLIEMVEARQQ